MEPQKSHLGWGECICLGKESTPMLQESYVLSDLFLFNKVTNNSEGVRFTQNPHNINCNKLFNYAIWKNYICHYVNSASQ